MRVTVDDVPSIGPIRVWVDDIEVTHRCFEADDEQGFALVRKLNEKGEPYLNRAMDAVENERLTGNVRIECAGIQPRPPRGV